MILAIIGGLAVAALFTWPLIWPIRETWFAYGLYAASIVAAFSLIGVMVRVL